MLWFQLEMLGRKAKFQMGYAVYPLTVLAPFALSAAVCAALTALVGWHAFIICKGQVCHLCFVYSLQKDQIASVVLTF